MFPGFRCWCDFLVKGKGVPASGSLVLQESLHKGWANHSSESASLLCFDALIHGAVPKLSAVLRLQGMKVCLKRCSFSFVQQSYFCACLSFLRQPQYCCCAHCFSGALIRTSWWDSPQKPECTYIWKNFPRVSVCSVLCLLPFSVCCRSPCILTDLWAVQQSHFSALRTTPSSVKLGNYWPSKVNVTEDTIYKLSPLGSSCQRNKRNHLNSARYRLATRVFSGIKGHNL